MIEQLKGKKNYTIERELHRGGFGITYLAKGIVCEGNIPHECSYTIKELFLSKYCQRNPDNSVSAPSDEAKSLFLTAKKKFLEEAKILQGLKHPNIVPVNEVFEQNGTAYYVMEYLGDTSLQQYVHQQGERLSEQEAINIINSLCNAVKYLHGKGILHLDIKPDNIMIFNGQPYLIDFGQALFFKSGKATSHSHIGGYSKGFSSAELRQGTVDSFRTDLDIYSIAATLYYMLTGKTPDEATSLSKKKIYTELLDTTDIRICEVIAKAMSPDIAERPADISDFLRTVNGGSITDTVILRKSQHSDILSHFNKSFLYTLAGIAAIVLILSILWPRFKTPIATSPDDNENTLVESKNGSVLPIEVKGITFNMVRVEGGTFDMGATPEQVGPKAEKPVHQVTLSSYYIGETEVTQALWQAVMGSNPSEFKGGNLPVEKVSWDDCQTFIERLNTITHRKFRLPTEAEWEFAARGGNKSRYTQYSGSDNLDEVAWYDRNSNDKTHPVKSKKANELGIYDMSGNVWEWCQDKYGKYDRTPQNNPTGPDSGTGRVSRGGSWYYYARLCRLSYRRNYSPDSRFNYLGLRLVLSE